MKKQITKFLCSRVSISKLKQLFITAVMFMVCVQFATAQQVSDGTDTYNADDLTVGLLAEKTGLTLTGEWTNAQLEKFKASLKSDVGEYTTNAILKTVDMSEVTFSEDISLGNLFKNISDLETVTLPTAEVSVDVSFNNAFYSCFKLTEIKNLDKFTSISDLSNAFSNCGNLGSISFSENTKNNTINMSDAFNCCRSLTEIKNLDKFTSISDLSNAFWSCANLVSISFSEANNNNKVNMSNAFNDCGKLTEIKNLDKFTSISDLSNAFWSCVNLGSISFSEEKNYNEVDMNTAFQNCLSLTEIKNLDKFTSISNLSNAFWNCGNLGSISFSEDTNSNSVNMMFAFSVCTSLTEIKNLDKFTSISDLSNAFWYCENLTSVKLGRMPTGNKNLAFDNANPNMLKYLPEGVTIPSEWIERNYKNFIIDGKCDNLELVNGKPYNCPEAFSMTEGASATLNYTPALTLSSDYKQGWNAIALPFAVESCSATLGTGSTLNAGEVYVKSYTRSGFDKLGFATISSVSGIEADKPYLLGAADNSAVTFTSATGVSIPVTETKSVSVNGLTFTSDYSYTPLTDTKSTLVMNGEGSAYMIASNLAKAEEEETVTVVPFSGYFVREAGRWVAEEMSIAKETEVDLPTGVEMVDANASTKIYGVAGKVIIEAPEATMVAVSNVSGAVIGQYQVSEGTTEIELPQGMYIINNKKVIVK